MTGVKPAAIIDLMHDFWSIRGMSTYLASGFSSLIDNMQNVNVIPVAMGVIKQLFTKFNPCRESHISVEVNLFNLMEA